MSCPMTRDIYNWYQVFGSGIVTIVTTWFKDLCLLRPGIEHVTLRMRAERYVLFREHKTIEDRS